MSNKGERNTEARQNTDDPFAGARVAGEDTKAQASDPTKSPLSADFKQAVKSSIYYGDNPDEYVNPNYGLQISQLQSGKLTAPPPRPGFAQRWVKCLARDGSVDTAHLSTRQREGWRPRNPETVPPLYNSLVRDVGIIGGCIVVDGHVLCEMPERALEMIRQMKRERAHQASQQVRNDYKKLGAKAETATYDESKTTVTKGMRRGAIAPD